MSGPEQGRRPRGPSEPGKPGPAKGSRGPGDRPNSITLARIQGKDNAFELVHPRCVHETEPDYEEGIELWKAGDPQEARDALRYILSACQDNLHVHVALGRIALEEFKDPALARGHFGYAVELVRKAIPPSFSGQLPRGRRDNRPFYEAVEGLVKCLRALGKTQDADSLTAMAKRLAGPSSRASRATESANPSAAGSPG